MLVSLPLSFLSPKMKVRGVQRSSRRGCRMVRERQRQRETEQEEGFNNTSIGGVSCEVQDRETQQTKTIKAEYMIAADGANSFVRSQLSVGATLSGKGLLGKLVSVLFKVYLVYLLSSHPLPLPLPLPFII